MLAQLMSGSGINVPFKLTSCAIMPYIHGPMQSHHPVHGGAIKPCIVKPAAEMTRRLDGNGVFGRCVKRVPDFSDLWDYSMHIPNVRRGSYSEAVHIGQIRPPYCYQKAA